MTEEVFPLSFSLNPFISPELKTFPQNKGRWKLFQLLFFLSSFLFFPPRRHLIFPCLIIGRNTSSLFSLPSPVFPNLISRLAPGAGSGTQHPFSFLPAPLGTAPSSVSGAFPLPFKGASSHTARAKCHFVHTTGGSVCVCVTVCLRVRVSAYAFVYLCRWMLIPAQHFSSPYQGKATTRARAALLCPKTT